MATNKRKTTTIVIAGVTAAALLLGGTFAWTSISQQAKNEAIVDINPGGRLHDDFNGANKDVYVENFGDEITGVNIFARIRLDQYMEVGQEAGKNKDADSRNVKTLIGGSINDESTWETYKPTAETLEKELSVSDYWTWYLGNDDSNMPYYMPTFNMNKDSLAADINGTYEGTTPDDIVHYDDYKVYSADSKTTADEIYDWDEDSTEETDEKNNYDNGGVTTDRSTPIDSADVLKEEKEHTAKRISEAAEVITMAQWLTLLNDEDPDNDTGNFWVYDEDGWAYWANPIAPGETTGLLLDGINMSKVPDDNWYYGINVVGQFATASDWEMFFAPEADGGAGEGQMTENAKTLMELITGLEREEITYALLTQNGVDAESNPTYTLSFVESRTMINADDTYEGVDIVAVYSNVGEEQYTADNRPSWYAYVDKITKVSIEEEIQPTSTAYWFADMNALTTIDGLANLNTSKVSGMENMFSECINLTTIEGISGWDVGNVKSMNSMFYKCEKLATLGDISGWNVSNVTDTSWMFLYCGELTQLDLSEWVMGNVTKINNMFQFCEKLTTVGDISSWNVSNVQEMVGTFAECPSLTEIGDISVWDVSNVTRLHATFRNCSQLTGLDLSGWDVTNVTDNVQFSYNAGGITAPNWVN